VHDLDQLITVGNSAASVLRDEGDWIHRRVESLTFPFPDESVYRRKLSIDFSIPQGLVPIDGGVRGTRSPRYYVPLSFLAKWPPLDQLDLVGEDGKTIPFLTGRQNRILDAAVLVQMAEDATISAALTEDEKKQVSDDQKRQLAEDQQLLLTEDQKLGISKIALAPHREAKEAFDATCPSATGSPDRSVPPTIAALRKDPIFVALARKLCHSTILWLRTEADVEDREIVKFAYDIPWELDIPRFSRAAFGLAPFLVQFDTPHVGATGSYHLNLTMPAPLEAAEAELLMFDASASAASGESIDRGAVRHQATPGHPVQPPDDGLGAYADVRGQRAKFYVSGDRNGLAGRIYVGLKVQADGFLFSACMGSALIALVLGAFAAEHQQVTSNNNSSVAVLLVVPALLAYLLRPSEHLLVGGLLAGLRRLAVLGGVWPLIAAVCVVTISGGVALQWCLAALALLEACTGGALSLPLIYDRRRRRSTLRT
jgi:hypothetical protein